MKLIASALLALGLLASPSLAMAEVTPESIAYTQEVMATVDPVVYECTVESGDTYIQYRYYTSETSYISNYQAGTVSCVKWVYNPED